jgi:Ca-activated chloride channel homolog
MTNLSGGWLRGRELVAGESSDRTANRVLLLTDGLANVGITDPELLVGLCRGALAQGITTTTIGFGQGFDEDLLRRLAEAGGGSTYYIEQPDQAPAVFAAEIEGLLALSAQNVTVELRPAAAAQGTIVHHRYPSQPIEGGSRYELGDLYARDPRLLLAEFVILSSDRSAEVDVAELVVTAHVISGGSGVERREIRLPIRASLGGGARVDPEIRKELLLLEAARAREEAREAQRKGDYDGARERLDGAREMLAACESPDEDLLEEVEDLHQMSELFRLRTAGEADAKYLNQRSLARTTNRRASADAISRVRRGQ